jgi:2-hydroxychromene-2-carboxylate isomerase
VREQLAASTAAAARAGVREAPAVRVGEHVFAGARALEQAAEHLASVAAAAR